MLTRSKEETKRTAREKDEAPKLPGCMKVS